MSREPWYESDNPNRIGWGVGRWVVAILVGILIIGAVYWGLTVLVSGPKGQGDAFRAKNSGTNRVAAQERFETMYQNILAADRRLDPLAKQAKSGTVVDKKTYTGGVTFCQQIVADYNAEARKYSARDFRAIDLPSQIDDLDPATDCKESKS